MAASAINPGDVRTFKRGDDNAVVVGLGLWAERQGKWVHIHMTGPNRSHTTVTNNPKSAGYHRTLFHDLRETLLANDCWPFGSDGAETQGSEDDPAAHFRPVPILGGSISETIIAERGE